MDGHVGIIYDCDLISWPARGFILLHSTDESFYKMEGRNIAKWTLVFE